MNSSLEPQTFGNHITPPQQGDKGEQAELGRILFNVTPDLFYSALINDLGIN